MQSDICSDEITGEQQGKVGGGGKLVEAKCREFWRLVWSMGGTGTEPEPACVAGVD